jgi:hypothetical protein
MEDWLQKLRDKVHARQKFKKEHSRKNEIITPQVTKTPDPLPVELRKRIRHCFGSLAEVYPTPIDQILDDFRGDPEPEKGLAFWEAVASAYTEFVLKRKPTAEGRREAFKILSHMLISGKGIPASKLCSKNLPEADVKWLQERFKL